MDDMDLKNKILEGNKKGIDDLIDEYGPMVKSIVRLKLGSYTDCIDECVNNVFIGVW